MEKDKKIIVISDISFDIHDGPIGISVSGGADSSLLLYILMKYCECDIHVFTCASKQKHRVAPSIVTAVIDKCIDDTNFKYSVYHHVYFVDVQTKQALFGGLATISRPLNLSVIYTAITNNPTVEITNTFKNGDNGLSGIRDPSVQKPVYHEFTENTRIYTPLANIDKVKVRKIYDELIITDSIFPITRSCESLSLKKGHCGDCWWCEERMWAFGRLE